MCHCATYFTHSQLTHGCETRYQSLEAWCWIYSWPGGHGEENSGDGIFIATPRNLQQMAGKDFSALPIFFRNIVLLWNIILWTVPKKIWLQSNSGNQRPLKSSLAGPCAGWWISYQGEIYLVLQCDPNSISSRRKT